MILSRKIILCILLLSSKILFVFTTNAQNCFDADFESGTLGGYTAYHGEITNQGLVIFPNQNIENSQHKIMQITDGFDPIAEQFCDQNKNLLVTGTGTGKYTLRLGDADNGARTSKVELSFEVTSDVSFFLLKYAIVINDPSHNHSVQPRFELNIKDQDGNLLDCGAYEVRAAEDIPGFESCENWRVRPWTTAGFELESYLGQTISIEIISTDCGLGGHGGYAYIDATCSPLKLDLQSYCPGSGFAKYFVTEGFDSYLWNTGETTNTLDIINPVPGQEYEVTVTSSTGCTLVLRDTLPELPEIDDLIPSFFDGPDSLQVCFGEEITYQPTGTNINEVHAIELEYTSDIFFLFAEESRIINFVTADNLGCEYDTTQLVLTVSNLDLDIEVTAPCEGEANGELLIDNLGDNSLMTALNDLNYSTNYYYDNLTPGEYVLNLTNGIGCEFAKNINIVAKEPPEVSEILISPATCDESNGSITLVSPNPLYVYSFNNGDFEAQSSWSDLSGGTYTIKYKNVDEGCIKEDIIILDSYKSPILKIESMDSTYCGEDNGRLVLSTAEGYPPFQYSINGSDFLAENTYLDLPSQTYLVIIRDGVDCKDSISTIIEAAPFGKIENTVTTAAFCNEDNGSLTVTLADKSIPHMIHVDDILLDNNFVENLSSGSKKVKLIDHNGCIDSLIAFVDYLEAPQISEIVYLANPCGVEQAQISIIASSTSNKLQYSSYENQYQNDNSFSLNPDEYTLTVKDEMGCIVDTTINILKEEYFLLANIFSPNDDGINDEFCFQSTNGVAWVDEFHIYDRWGNEVFSFTNPTELMQSICWDGNFNERQVETGVYVYYFRARLTDGRLLCKNGDVTVIR
ncbi:MAG TPA: hypothetical protein DCM04_00225 [Saprospirales bacterium]|nr:hypothetical protein [Saprospirales bacterium]|tara:strand:- start:277 stop:2847 length:2571 start_codon:yes stop_codon:yes gene_type:complete